MSTKWGIVHKKFSNSNITIYANGNGTPDTENEFTAIQAALQTWSSVNNSNLSLSYGGTTSRVTTSGDNFNDIGWIESNWPYSSGSLAVTVYRFNSSLSSSVLFEADIFINGTSFSWTTTGQSGWYDVQNIVTHELGHCLNLQDLYGNNDVEKTMYGFGAANETKKRTLENGDLLGAKYLYPNQYTYTFKNIFDFDAETNGYISVKNLTQETNLVNYSSPQTKIVTHGTSFQFNSEATLYVAGKNYDFYGWSSGTSDQIFSHSIYSNYNLLAQYKARLLSSTTDAFSTNSQRKTARTINDNHLHLVYESNGQIWYMRSTDYGATWNKVLLIAENGSLGCKNPSIAANSSKVVITYQENTEFLGSYRTMIHLVTIENGSIVSSETIDDKSYLYDMNPVVSINNLTIVVVWKPSSSSGLKLKSKYYNGSVWNWTSENTVPNTNNNSTNPSIMSEYYSDYHALAWQNKGLLTQYGTQIEIRCQPEIYVNPYGNISYYNYSVISSGSGYVTNQNASVTMVYGRPIVSWTGVHTTAGLDKIAKVNSVTTKKAIARVKIYSGWSSTFYNGGDNVDYSNLNGVSGTTNDLILGWSKNSGQNSEFTKRKSGNFQCVKNLSSNGLQLQVSNASSFSNIKAYVFSGSGSSPYPIAKVTNNFNLDNDCSGGGGGLDKTSDISDISYGRNGIMSYGDLEFVFGVGDIVVDGENISFTEINDTLPINSVSDLNAGLISHPFDLNENSSFLFSSKYYMINPEFADSLLSENDEISFKVELLNSSNEIVGTYNSNTFTKNNLQDFESFNYSIDCNGIQSGEHKLRLVVNANGNPTLTLANLHNDASLLNKKYYETIGFSGSELPTEYTLAQNYPNPFNPTTQIKFAIPQDGIVSLKIFDVLGKEVKTLLNEYRNKGSYEVQFNASDLASGVYIYQIKVNDFAATKKMMLLK